MSGGLVFILSYLISGMIHHIPFIKNMRFKACRAVKGSGSNIHGGKEQRKKPLFFIFQKEKNSTFL